MKHTKGPWIVSKFNGDVDIFIDTKCGLSVASCYSEEVGMEETRTNATLIAAAPELLEMLDHVFHNYEIKSLPLDINYRILELIKKAKGEAETPQQGE